MQEVLLFLVIFAYCFLLFISRQWPTDAQPFVEAQVWLLEATVPPTCLLIWVPSPSTGRRDPFFPPPWLDRESFPLSYVLFLSLTNSQRRGYCFRSQEAACHLSGNSFLDDCTGVISIVFHQLCPPSKLPQALVYEESAA